MLCYHSNNLHVTTEGLWKVVFSVGLYRGYIWSIVNTARVQLKKKNTGLDPRGLTPRWTGWWKTASFKVILTLRWVSRELYRVQAWRSSQIVAPIVVSNAEPSCEIGDSKDGSCGIQNLRELWHWKPLPDSQWRQQTEDFSACCQEL
jgi:hypothetical protein